MDGEMEAKGVSPHNHCTTQPSRKKIAMEIPQTIISTAMLWVVLKKIMSIYSQITFPSPDNYGNDHTQH